MSKTKTKNKIYSVNIPLPEVAHKKAIELALVDYRTPGKLMGMLLEKALEDYEKILIRPKLSERTN